MSVSTKTEEKTEHLLNPRELSGVLGLGLTSIYELVWSGAIHSVRIGRLRKVRRADIDRFIEECLEGMSGHFRKDLSDGIRVNEQGEAEF